VVLAFVLDMDLMAVCSYQLILMIVIDNIVEYQLLVQMMLVEMFFVHYLLFYLILMISIEYYLVLLNVDFVVNVYMDQIHVLYLMQ
jgi:hypothetical protein